MAAPQNNPTDRDRTAERPNRRAEDQRDPASGGVDNPRTPPKLMARFRQPLIGLGLAGLAVPLVRATSPAEEQGTPEPAAPAADDAAAAIAAAEDPEEELVERIAMTQEEQAREAQVERAVEQYNISRDLAEDIYDIARETNIEPRLAFGLVKTESTFNERAVSHVGARGLTQVMPRTAAWLVPGTKTQDLYDRQTNLRLGFTYLDQMIDKYKGNVRLALLAYNRGPGTVDRVLRRGGNPDNGYADKVLRG
jgi:soluble lytic murein transglycosylase-like protein